MGIQAIFVAVWFWNSMYRFLVAFLYVPILLSPFFFIIFLIQSSVCFNDKTTLVVGFLSLELVNKEGFGKLQCPLNKSK